MATTKPIRIGFIGLSQNGSWGPYAHLPYLQSELGKKSYTIAALCNSSVEAAKASIAKFGFDPATKAYGSPEDLANDPDIDLVVCVTTQRLHGPTLRPSIAKGKRIFSESPLGRSLDETQQLVDLAKQAGIQSKDLAVVLEEPFDACVFKVKEIVACGLIGRVVHSSLEIAGAPLRSTVSVNHESSLKHENGSWVTVMMHVLSAVTFAIGPLADCSSQVVNAFPQAELMDGDGKVVKTVSKEIADHKILAGQFKSTIPSHAGATFSGIVRASHRFADEPMLTWRIIGDKGQLRITAPHMPVPELSEGSKIEHFDHSSNETAEIEWLRDARHSEEEGILSTLPGPARTIGRLYEAFAKGAHVGAADWERGLDMFKLVDALEHKGEYKA